MADIEMQLARSQDQLDTMAKDVKEAERVCAVHLAIKGRVANLPFALTEDSPGGCLVFTQQIEGTRMPPTTRVILSMDTSDALRNELETITRQESERALARCTKY